MLSLNLQRAISDKGIENSSHFLRNCGITSYTASRLLNNRVESINFKHLELICLGLKCTIDDLFVWQPDKDTADIENHPLQKLKLKEHELNLNQKLKLLPFNKVKSLKNYIDKLNTEDNGS
ncbi:MAG: helix-turn-helix transcriptional regulator [Bacteroidota bacterium]